MSLQENAPPLPAVLCQPGPAVYINQEYRLAESAVPHDDALDAFARDSVATFLRALPSRTKGSVPVWPSQECAGLLDHAVEPDTPIVVPMITINTPTTRFLLPGLSGFRYPPDTFRSGSGWAASGHILRASAAPIDRLYGAIFGEYIPRLRWSDAYRIALERHRPPYSSAYRLGRAVTAVASAAVRHQYQQLGIDEQCLPTFTFEGLRVWCDDTGALQSEKCEPML